METFLTFKIFQSDLVPVLTTLSEKAINKNLKNPFENISRNGMASKMSIFSFPHGGRKEQIKKL